MKKYIAASFICLGVGFYLGNHVVAKNAGKKEVIQALDALKGALEKAEEPEEKSEFTTKTLNFEDTQSGGFEDVIVNDVDATLGDAGVIKEE